MAEKFDPAVKAGEGALAMVKQEAGPEDADAEAAYKKALPICERTMGKNAPNVADCLEKLAAIYRKTDRAPEAEALESRVTRIRKTHH